MTISSAASPSVNRADNSGAQRSQRTEHRSGSSGLGKVFRRFVNCCRNPETNDNGGRRGSNASDPAGNGQENLALQEGIIPSTANQTGGPGCLFPPGSSATSTAATVNRRGSAASGGLDEDVVASVAQQCRDGESALPPSHGATSAASTNNRRESTSSDTSRDQSERDSGGENARDFKLKFGLGAIAYTGTAAVAVAAAVVVGVPVVAAVIGAGFMIGAVVLCIRAYRSYAHRTQERQAAGAPPPPPGAPPPPPRAPPRGTLPTGGPPTGGPPTGGPPTGRQPTGGQAKVQLPRVQLPRVQLPTGAPPREKPPMPPLSREASPAAVPTPAVVPSMVDPSHFNFINTLLEMEDLCETQANRLMELNFTDPGLPKPVISAAKMLTVQQSIQKTGDDIKRKIVVIKEQLQALSQTKKPQTLHITELQYVLNRISEETQSTDKKCDLETTWDCLEYSHEQLRDIKTAQEKAEALDNMLKINTDR